MKFVDRTEESTLTSWYFETDRRLLGWILLLIFIGVLCVISAGSVQALRKGWHWYYFLQKMLPFYVVGIGTLFVSSMFNKKWVFNISVLNLVVCMLLLLWTVINPVASHGSARWAVVGGLRLMPSDIMKPGLIIVTAWFLSKMEQKYSGNIFLNSAAWRPGWLSWWTYLIPFALVLLILFMQPDVGTTLLFLSVIGIMFFVSGLPAKIWVPLLGGIGGLGFLAFYSIRMCAVVFWHFFNRLIQKARLDYQSALFVRVGCSECVTKRFPKKVCRMHIQTLFLRHWPKIGGRLLRADYCCYSF